MHSLDANYYVRISLGCPEKKLVEHERKTVVFTVTDLATILVGFLLPEGVRNVDVDDEPVPVDILNVLVNELHALVKG